MAEAGMAEDSTVVGSAVEEVEVVAGLVAAGVARRWFQAVLLYMGLIESSQNPAAPRMGSDSAVHPPASLRIGSSRSVSWI